MKQLKGMRLRISVDLVFLSVQFLALLSLSHSSFYDTDWSPFIDGEDHNESHETVRTFFDDSENGNDNDSNFEGDIDLERDQQVMFEFNDEPVQSFDDNVKEKYQWPKTRNGFVVIPYAFEINKFCKFLIFKVASNFDYLVFRFQH